ncbi:hypothetical protein ABZ674_08060 [Streptomyces massasporeus]
MTAHLDALGVPVFGVDVSPRMIEPARAAYQELRFTPTIRCPASPACCRRTGSRNCCTGRGWWSRPLRRSARSPRARRRPAPAAR